MVLSIKNECFLAGVDIPNHHKVFRLETGTDHPAINRPIKIGYLSFALGLILIINLKIIVFFPLLLIHDLAENFVGWFFVFANLFLWLWSSCSGCKICLSRLLENKVILNIYEICSET
jgi:hypothetical protein